MESALTELGRRSFEAGRTVEIAVYGGSALLLTLNRQIGTGDVDAVFERDKDFVKKLAAEMAAEFGWDEDWLNDGVKGWLSASDANPEAKSLFKTYPSEEHQGLRVFVAKPEYLFAMKCRAMRVGGIETSPDIEDIRLLAREIRLRASKMRWLWWKSSIPTISWRLRPSSDWKKNSPLWIKKQPRTM